MQYMKRVLPLLFISLFLTNYLSAQTTFWTENFGTGCTQGNSAAGTVTGNGTWAITNVTAPAADANKWFVSATEAGVGIGVCGDGCIANAALTNRTLHIGSVPTSPSAGIFCPTGDCGAAYDSGGGCPGFGCVSVNDRAESPIINCTGQSTITLNFVYLEGNGDISNDFMEVMYSANGGGTWASLTTPGSTNNAGCGASQGKWTSFSIALPASATNNANVKIGFRWQNNDDGVGNDPSVAIDDITLSVPSAAIPVVTIIPAPNDTICKNATLTLNGLATNPPITAWAWTVSPTPGVVFAPDTFSQNPTVTFTAAGTYTFTLFATNASGTGSITQVITVIPNASVSFNTNVITAGIPQTISFTNSSSANSTGFYWTFGDNTSSVLQTPAPHTYNMAGTYTIVLIAYGVNGCNDTLSTLLLVADSVGITVPNIFTPNGDNINDVFQPSIHGTTSFECTIYDRWGLKVYGFAGAQDHWDGFTTGGLPCVDGTYYYILKATDRNNKAYDLKGFLQLIH